ncbi:type II secretion system protein [Coraliomargarita sp. W4R72]
MKKKSPHASAFTLIELLTVIAIIAVLAGILIPTIGRVRVSAESSKCVSNLRNIGVGALGFAASNNGRYPTLRGATEPGAAWEGPFWTDQIEPYVGSKSGADLKQQNMTDTSSFYCPSAELHHAISDYGVNQAVIIEPDSENSPGLPTVRVQDPSRVIFAVDCGRIWQGTQEIGSWTIPTAWVANPASAPWQATGPQPFHGDSLNVLYCDGSVVSMTYDELLNISPEAFSID